MNQAIQGDHSSTPPILPVKRKRGRPRKNQSLNHTEFTHVPPGFEGVRGRQSQGADSMVDANDGMVGQAVTGVVEAAFDAGYLLRVRIGNSVANFRGVVFKPGHYVPVTAENDVAPHAQMIRRNDIHVRGNNLSTNSAGLNGLPSANQLHGLAHRTTNTTATKGKYSAPAAPSVPPVGARGTVVPVVLQPAGLLNGFTATHQVPSDTAQDLGDSDEVHSVEPLAILPPAPSQQMLVAQNQSLPSQTHVNQQGAQGSAPNRNSSFGGATITGQEEVKQVHSAEIHAPDDITKGLQDSSPSSEIHDKNCKEVRQFLSEEPDTPRERAMQNVHPNLHEHSISVSQPLKSYPTGRMTELLLALQENMTENQACHDEDPSSGSSGDHDDESTD